MQFSNVVHKPFRFPAVASCVDRLLSGESSSLGLSFQSGMEPSEGHARPQKVVVRACDARDAPEMALRRRYTLDGAVTPPNPATRGVDRNQMHLPHPGTSLGSVVFHDVNTSGNSSSRRPTRERVNGHVACMVAEPCVRVRVSGGMQFRRVGIAAKKRRKKRALLLASNARASVWRCLPDRTIFIVASLVHWQCDGQMGGHLILQHDTLTIMRHCQQAFAGIKSDRASKGRPPKACHTLTRVGSSRFFFNSLFRQQITNLKIRPGR